MNKKLKTLSLRICHVLELIMAFALIAAIIIYGVRLLGIYPSLLREEPLTMFNTFLADIMTMAVGVESVKMLAEHNAATIIEVLMFAIARQMVVAHGTSVDIILGVVAIAALFATRKYLFEETDTTDFE